VSQPARMVVLTEEALGALLDRALAPLRLELEKLRGGDTYVIVPFSEAARRLGVDVRTVQRRAKDGRLEVVEVGGERMARLPAGLAGG
jgi:excisionase family DNA binding protein